MTASLYRWDTVDVLRRYSTGDIIVAADSVEEAREIVRRAFVKFVKADEHGERCTFQVDEYADDEEESKANWKKALDRLEVDLAKDPLTGTVAFVWGSE